VAAARTVRVKDVLRAFMREYTLYPATAVSRLNDYVCDTHDFDERGEERFVCLSLAMLSAQTGEGFVLAAGCEPPLVLRADGRVDVFETTGLPMGV
jgi:serine phosphatase RsbU (regulator of sigma subunit)